MKLTKLRLLGFKSFVEPTDFLIEPGLTGVVGPNGCGKSNLVEALRWVMGESSYKSMRASNMDDVIFSGTNNRPARNTAEVGITIDNATRSAPAAFNDEDRLEIARRIERDAGSTYRINGQEVRARDVQILFADASTGARSPALVHQGRIGEIIQAKPEQRRRVLEDAAGVAGLHQRRHEAELRLKAAESNLLRVEDVIGQLASQIDGLKKQARQAIRYRTVSAQVRKSEAMLFHVRFVAAQTEVIDAESTKTAAVTLVGERTSAQAQASTRQTEAAAALPALRDTEARAGAALHRLNLALQELEREEARAKDRIGELELRLVQIAADSEREKRLAADADAALERLAGEEQTIRREAQESAGKRDGIDARVAAADGALAEAEKIFSELTAQLADLTAKRNQFEAAARDHAERAARLRGEVAAVERELASLRSTEAEPLDAALTGAQAALTEAETAAVAAEAAHIVAREQVESARTALAEAERHTQRLETEAKTLAKVLAVETRNLWPPVIDHISVAKGYEKALGAALGDDLDAPVDPSAPMHWTNIAADAADPALPEGVTALSAHVGAPGALSRRLAQIGVVDKETGNRLAGALKPGQRLVSPDGDLWRWDGFVAAAHAPTGAARRLAQRSRLSEIEGELPAAHADVEDRRGALQQAQAAFDTAAASETETRSRERELNRQTARLSALAEARARLTASLDEAVAGQAEAERALAALAPAADTEHRLTQVRDDIGGKRATLAELRAEQQAIVREAEQADRRLQSIAGEVASWNERRDGARNQIATLDQRNEDARRERTELEHAPQVFAEKRGVLSTEVERAEIARREAAERLAQGEATLAGADRDARAALEAASAAREELARAEERAEAAKRRLADVGREIREVLEIDPDGLTELAGLKPGAALPETSEIEATLERLRRERERLGAVNLRAEEELREVEAQHGKLTAERDDLNAAIHKLRLGIQSLNREARERLLASFITVNQHFQHLFAKLFGGGAAELKLIESDDPLEAGLEIFAKPPGKKPSTLSLLSGGEQALTALALIFAVFLTNPAPICVLDEVDAPLDDHNVERFCDLLDEMTKSTDTRFVIITHNPITMARMNRLFGVTMAERGVSQLVSVDLEAAVKFREAS
jgi:chromosome segregation protein